MSSQSQLVTLVYAKGFATGAGSAASLMRQGGNPISIQNWSAFDWIKSKVSKNSLQIKILPLVSSLALSN